MFDRLVLGSDLLDCRGDVLAARGTVLSAESIGEAASRARPAPARALGDTPLAADVEAPLDARTYEHLFSSAAVRGQVRSALLGVRLPEVLFEELRALRDAGSPIHAHAFAAAAVAVRMLLGVVGASRGIPELAAAALLHDLGMRHVPPRLGEARERLREEDVARIAAHPLLGAWHLATVLGPHPAVASALGHHWRCGQGYPTLRSAPTRSIEVISVASAFVALTHPRPFRPCPYDARGAADVLVAEAAAKQADLNTVKLLVHALRGGRGDPRAVRFGHDRGGHGPEVSRYVHVMPPPRSLV